MVATPIGNLTDISKRALEVLANVSCILAEDTRHSKRLLNHYGIRTRLRACHDHNEAEQVGWLCAQLESGVDIALISDAGTPLISDPGYVLVSQLRKRSFRVQCVPGPSAIVAALSVAGLPTDRFVFDGFLPAKSAARQAALAVYALEGRTVVLLESSHRIEACLVDIVSVLGPQRRVVLARELTKKFETVLDGDAADLVQRLKEDPDQTRGEFVLLIEGVTQPLKDDQEVLRMLQILMAELPLKQAAALVASLADRKKNEVYKLALSLK
ncbi:MAG: 16S rRNA (cytidine(1402)-2'-O)-methyltransferase [Gammaproteobacteria bacterium]|nr:16S rRNA (cytidine(1402)-2'-O)-methyltransferase [Gammaproteobacteria bacterium]